MTVTEHVEVVEGGGGGGWERMGGDGERGGGRVECKRVDRAA